MGFVDSQKRTVVKYYKPKSGLGTHDYTVSGSVTLKECYNFARLFE